MQAREYRGKASEEAVRAAGKSVVILSGDAEFDSWAQITAEYPKIERTSDHDPLVKRMVNYLACAVVKVAHHGSMHSASLDVCEKMSPKYAIISTKQKSSTAHPGGVEMTREMFPHLTTTLALRECGADILTTDDSFDTIPHLAGAGTIVVVIPPGGRPRVAKLDDESGDVKPPPAEA
jgi:hypothetical protein